MYRDQDQWKEDMMEELLTVAEVSKALKVTRDQVYRWAKSGVIQSVRLKTGGIRFTEQQVLDFMVPQKHEKNLSEKT